MFFISRQTFEAVLLGRLVGAESTSSTNSAIHKAAGLTVFARSMVLTGFSLKPSLKTVPTGDRQSSDFVNSAVDVHVERFSVLVFVLKDYPVRKIFEFSSLTCAVVAGVRRKTVAAEARSLEVHAHSAGPARHRGARKFLWENILRFMYTKRKRIFSLIFVAAQCEH